MNVRLHKFHILTFWNKLVPGGAIVFYRETIGRTDTKLSQD